LLMKFFCRLGVPIYDIYPDEKYLLKEVTFVVDTIKFIEENNYYHVFDESPHNEGFQLSNDEISYFIFMGLKIFYQIPLLI